jgi:hypothetical protein
VAGRHRDELDLIADSEKLGFGHAWLTEHHLADDGYSPSLMTIAGAAVARTSRIRIGTFVVLLPLHDPITVAEDAATLDVLSNGRFDLGVGQGYVPHGFEPRGIRHSSRAPHGGGAPRPAWAPRRGDASLARSHGSHLVLCMAMPGNEAEITRRSMELFAKHARPGLG